MIPSNVIMPSDNMSYDVILAMISCDVTVMSSVVMMSYNNTFYEVLLMT